MAELHGLKGRFEPVVSLGRFVLLGVFLVLGVRLGFAQSDDDVAYFLDQRFDFHTTAARPTNTMGGNEKWIRGNGSQFFYVLPDGEMFRWTGGAAGSDRDNAWAHEFIADIGVDYYAISNLIDVAEPSGYSESDVTASGEFRVAPFLVPSSAGGSATVTADLSDLEERIDFTIDQLWGISGILLAIASIFGLERLFQ